MELLPIIGSIAFIAWFVGLFAMWIILSLLFRRVRYFLDVFEVTLSPDRSGGDCSSGMRIDVPTGRVIHVQDGGKAHSKGVREGLFVAKVNNEDYDPAKAPLAIVDLSTELSAETTIQFENNKGAIRYLPTKVDGTLVLSDCDGQWKIDNTCLKADTPGLGWRKSKSLDDKDGKKFYAWGSKVIGIVDGDWIKIKVEKDKPITAAHQVVVLVPFIFLAAFGSWLWFFDRDFALAFKGDKRVYGSYQPAITLVTVMLAFQIWDFIATLVMMHEAQRPKSQIQHLIHHFSSSCLCLLGLLNGKHGFLMYYAGFFFGVSEISSIPLGFKDLFDCSEFLKKERASAYEATKVSFALLFLIIRCIYWPFVVVDFFIAVVPNKVAPVWLKIIWYVFCIGLTLLQYYWGSLVVRGIVNKMRPPPSAARDVALLNPTEQKRVPT